MEQAPAINERPSIQQERKVSLFDTIDVDQGVFRNKDEKLTVQLLCHESGNNNDQKYTPRIKQEPTKVLEIQEQSPDNHVRANPQR
jgi:hypothetical protein